MISIFNALIFNFISITSGEEIPALIDPSHNPYYVRPNESATDALVSPLLDGKNYHAWSRSMMKVVIMKNFLLWTNILLKIYVIMHLIFLLEQLILFSHL
jgi:hypothetical protein